LILFGVMAPCAAHAELSAGVAKRDLTPPHRVPMAGYSRRHGQLSTGVHDAPQVRALVLSDKDATVALASCDLLIIDERLFRAIDQRVHAASATPITLIVAATHTHSGPGAFGQKFLEKISMGHYDPAVFEFLASRIAETILAASQQRQPVTIRAGTVATTGLIKNRVAEGGPVDSELTLFAAIDGQGKPVAIVANFSAHPTTLGASNMQLSADYPGVLTRLVEEHAPGAVCLFTAGSVGDQAPIKHGTMFETSEAMGQSLAAEVIGWLDHPSTQPGQADLAARQQTMRLAPARVRLGRVTLPSAIGGLLVDDDADLSAVRIGDVLWMGVPCDFSAELGLTLKAFAREAGYQPMIIGFANDYIGYCLPERLYRSGAYEALMAFNGPRTGEDLLDALKGMAQELRR